MNKPEDKPLSDRMPRGAIATVIVGLIVTLMVIALDLRSSSAEEPEWPTTESVDSPAAVKLGSRGSFGLAETTISAIPPTEGGELLFRVAGVAKIASGYSAGPATVECSVTSPAESSTVARTPVRVAAWPRSDTELQSQFVPAEPQISLQQQENEGLTVPVRDTLSSFTDSDAPTEVESDGPSSQTRKWKWTMPEGTGAGTASLSYLVIFSTSERPRARITCSGNSGRKTEVVKLNAVLQEWPLTGDSLDSNGTEAEIGAEGSTAVE